jgi:iron-sulfur cluster assembly protein
MVTLSELAATKIKELLIRRGKGLGIQIGVKTTGCSGMAYTLEYVDSINDTPGITNFEQHNLCVLVDEKSLVYLSGLTVDWTIKGLNQGFEFINPNERDRCGCGESFRI